MQPQANEESFWPSIGRAALGRCPKCGKGKLFRAYLKPVESCAACGEPYGHIRADDGPAWLTIVIVGHIIVTGIMVADPEGLLPVWLSTTIWVVLALALTLVLLPRCKGLFIALIRRAGAPGSERA